MRSGSPEPRSIVVGGHRPGHQQPRPTPARALSEKERDKVFDTLCSERFVDRSPAEVVATLLDEDVYLCSERTMYRVLASQVPVRERRAQRSPIIYLTKGKHGRILNAWIVNLICFQTLPTALQRSYKPLS